MKKQVVKANLLLLLAAAIWGFAFVAQRVGMKYIGAFTFNAVRFALGSISLIPLILFYNNKNTLKNKKGDLKHVFTAGVLAGILLFIAASLQQVGLLGTTAGKAAFVTGLYIVFVPIMGIFLKQYIGINSWAGAIIAIMGLYFLCVTEKLSISYSDFLELLCAFFFAIHILVIDYLSQRVDTLKLAFFQFSTCSILSLITAISFENITINGILQASIPIIYGGICSVGIAYTLQIVAQKHAEPSHAAIILSMEAFFGTIGGFIILKEHLGVKGILGCALMLIGMLLSQAKISKNDDVAV
ncbi:transporter protein [Clostridium pasteurianum DSM 525 = ATCC 6013]|uniref:Transporter protein n=1 Tax=Clostridium pasteurianum DSM 525 = ATCC 6013 TaxID=1262449 RepID=A0A0H3J8B3_CLOPA|nr:DMT family transporter [Clostridium pasteurianum]AJA47285.1 transporter protein [Clostridium pasteurianum DSM 525 = ATCC 6013]AJA51273.1 transporter protein [Clostridium pasteurianum DSM 525 = ATCC 6013]AOZ74626.1 hypothetical protein AQ983_05725 [Clostridium pasteurianum DSM 525 = ATCC 6013]AOZ78423.1 hypothetical protein AQ984_05715 [Clostridium pasteurianum]ELP57516.1 transporter protein [Clostridium pasteurianum DSM 525 = ATCC 6013]